ncbi:NfeD family protein [Aureimonas sp. AU4]|uniref:NfeD family protein n=1 Tax=Aureimonas sp. AU4 TaxID=1638163 RepID=UPI000785B3B0|nr:NfeD family protein [Aureimonas sp. AU4]
MAEFMTSTGWWIAGLLLLGAEVFAPGVYLLFFGIAALVIGLNALIVPDLSWQSQVIGFAVVSAAVTLVGHRWYGQRRPAREGASPEPNRGAARLVGRHAVVSEAIRGGRGRVAIEDGWWIAEGPDLPAGTAVRVTGAEGSVLRVAPEPGAGDG